jgi:actin related protein 2/3 complex subunit 4
LPGIQPEHPEVEFSTSSELTLQPISIHRSSTESCFIEPTINSARISLKIKQTDDLERWLTKKWITLLTQAAYAEVQRRRFVQRLAMLSTCR